MSRRKTCGSCRFMMDLGDRADPHGYCMKAGSPVSEKDVCEKHEQATRC